MSNRKCITKGCDNVVLEDYQCGKHKHEFDLLQIKELAEGLVNENKILRQRVSIGIRANGNKWTKVEDELPAKGERVICKWHIDAVSETSPEITMQVLLDKEGCRLACVTHWMPLPSPPAQ